MSTWARTYIEVPAEVLFEFGIISNLPIVSYTNYIMNNPKNYSYPGEIFSGDAAWFDFYEIMDSSQILKSSSYKNLKKALENIDKNKSFIDFYNQSKDKWLIIPIINDELAEIATKLNNHIK